MTKEERYELLEYMERRPDVPDPDDPTTKDYIREMWLDHGDLLNDILEALYLIISHLESR